MMWNRTTMIAFEHADLNNDTQWFNAHWHYYKEEMADHALGSFPTFAWTSFRAWLAAYPHAAGATELLEAFEQA